MSRDLVIRLSAELEEILTRKFGAQGSGLGQKAISVEHLLPSDLSQKLRYIVSIRNKAAHEIDFELRDRDRFCQVCQEAKTMLNDLSVPSGGIPNPSSTTSNQSTKTIGIPKFFIPSDLVRFKCTLVPYLLTTDTTILNLTGRVIRCKERTSIVRTKNSQIENLEQKIWLQLENGQEDYIELLNFCLPVREGHHLTLLFSNLSETRYYLAIYIHELNRYFWHTNSWKKALLGIQMWPKMALIYFLYFQFGLPILSFILSPVTKGATFWIVTLIFIPLVIYGIVKSTTFNRFEKHIGKIFNSPRP